MSQYILAVTGAEVKPTQDFEQFRLQSVHIGFHSSPLASFTHDDVYFLPRFGNYIFDTRGMNAPIDNQLCQGQTCHFAAHRIETRKDNGLRCIIDDEVNTRGGFKRTNVAPLTTNDTAFHLVIRQRYDRNNGLRNLVRGTALNGEGNNFSRTGI